MQGFAGRGTRVDNRGRRSKAHNDVAGVTAVRHVAFLMRVDCFIRKRHIGRPFIGLQVSRGERRRPAVDADSKYHAPYDREVTTAFDIIDFQVSRPLGYFDGSAFRVKVEEMPADRLHRLIFKPWPFHSPL